MALANYTDLKTSIANWLARDDLTSVIDDFIDMAEADINSRLRTEEMLASTTLTTSSTTAFVSLPTDFLEIDNLSFDGDPRNIQFVTTKQLKQTKAGNATGAGRPTVYTITNSSSSGGAQRIQFGPNPDGAYTMTAIYYQQVPALSTGTTTNWLYSKRPQVYLYGSLKYACDYILDPESEAAYVVKFDRLIQEMATEDEGRKSGGAGMSVVTDTGNP